MILLAALVHNLTFPLGEEVEPRELYIPLSESFMIDLFFASDGRTLTGLAEQ